MNESTEISPQQSEGTPQAVAVATNPPVNPNLSAALREGGDAVEDDLRQAKEVAAALEVQLAGKSKETLHLKFLLDQTKAHFRHMQDSVTAMRAERHKLANDSMRAQGLGIMLSRVTAERDRLKKELDGVLEGLVAENAEKAQQALRFDKRDRMIAELTFELMNLRQKVADLQRGQSHPVPVAPEQATAAVLPEVEIVPTERVPGLRRRA